MDDIDFTEIWADTKEYRWESIHEYLWDELGDHLDQYDDTTITQLAKEMLDADDSEFLTILNDFKRTHGPERSAHGHTLGR